MTSSFSALPGRYLTGDEPGVGGRLKERPEDFIVQELPMYEPVGHGEHLYLFIEKYNRPTLDVVRDLARAFRVSPRQVGYAGMKDKVAVTQQLISILTPDDSPLETLNLRGVKVLWADRHSNKLRLGHLRGNRFVIRVRGASPTQAPRVLKMLKHLETVGVPNFLGPQRFGMRQNNHEVGRQYLLEDWQKACDVLLGGEEDGDDSRSDSDARRAYREGDYRKAADAWSSRQRSEHQASQTLARGRSPREAIMAIDNAQRRFFVSAFQSAVFNQLLEARMERGELDQLFEGDLAGKHTNQAVFSVGADELADPDTADRLTQLEVSPTGPLWGFEMMRAGGAVDEKEHEALVQTGVDLHCFEARHVNIKGARRLYRMRLTEPEVEGGADEHGEYLQTSFSLPRGAFATVVMREVMKSPAASLSTTDAAS